MHGSTASAPGDLRTAASCNGPPAGCYAACDAPHARKSFMDLTRHRVLSAQMMADADENLFTAGHTKSGPKAARAAAQAQAAQDAANGLH